MPYFQMVCTKCTEPCYRTNQAVPPGTQANVEMWVPIGRQKTLPDGENKPICDSCGGPLLIVAERSTENTGNLDHRDMSKMAGQAGYERDMTETTAEAVGINPHIETLFELEPDEQMIEAKSMGPFMLLVTNKRVVKLVTEG